MPGFARNDEFLKVLDRLDPEGSLGVAVSGGPDSLGLLLLASAARSGRVKAATVDHGLRSESAAEAAQVAACCSEIGVPHEVLTVAVAPGASLQAQAREARYAALGEWAEREGLAAVATGHHADDQAETLLLRLARGSGVQGLSGIREDRPLQGSVRLIRPLLPFRKAELIAMVEAAGWSAVDDPSNRDERHDRTRVRALLAANPWLDPERLARSAAALGEVDEALVQGVQQAKERHWSADADGISLRDVSLLPKELLRRLLLSAMEKMGTRPSGPEVDRLVAKLEDGRAATLGGAKVTPSAGDRWRVALAPPRRPIARRR